MISDHLKNRIFSYILRQGPVTRQRLAQALGVSTGAVDVGVRMIRRELGEDVIITTSLGGYRVDGSDEEVEEWSRTRMKYASTHLDVSASVLWSYTQNTENNRLILAYGDIQHAKSIIDHYVAAK